MSYRYHLLSSNVYIPTERLGAARDAAIEKAAQDGLGSDGEPTLAQVLEWYGFDDPVRTDRGLELRSCYPDEASADPEELMEALAPYAADGTRLIWEGEDFAIWRGGFSNGSYVFGSADLSKIP